MPVVVDVVVVVVVMVVVVVAAVFVVIVVVVVVVVVVAVVVATGAASSLQSPGKELNSVPESAGPKGASVTPQKYPHQKMFPHVNLSTGLLKLVQDKGILTDGNQVQGNII